MVYICLMRRFFLNNELLNKQSQQVDALLNNRYPVTDNSLVSPWKNTLLFGCRDHLQTLKFIRLIGEGNPSLQELKSYAAASSGGAVKIRDNIRQCCQQWQQSQIFESEVQIDELLLHGSQKSGRSNPAVLVIAAADNSRAIFIPLKNQKRATLQKLILKHVAKGTKIKTDGWIGYQGLGKLGYQHQASIKPKLPAAHTAISSWRRFIGDDRRPNVNLEGKCAHAAFCYSHRKIGSGRSDALLDLCMLPGRPKQETGTHVIRLTFQPSRVEKNMLFRRLAHQDLFLRLLQKWARHELHDLTRSKAWRAAYYHKKVDMFNATNFSRNELDFQATRILNNNPDLAHYVDRATANSLVTETYTAFRKAAWGGHTLPRSKKRTIWNGNNQRQGLRLIDGFIVHSSAKMKPDHQLHIPFSLASSLGKKREAYYEERIDSLRKISLKREWVRGQMKWFLLMTFECRPYRDQNYLNSVAEKGVVGLDVNKGGIGVASAAGARTISLSELAIGLTEKANRLRSERDKLKERNPDWADSKRYWRLHNQFRRASRNARLRRDQAWRQIARTLRQAGKTIITERDHIAAWKQGRARDTILQSVAPSRLKQLIKTEFEATGGKYVEVTAKTVKATATCPGCGNVQGKDTSQRLHDCQCGSKMCRDSAAAINLARYSMGIKKHYPIRNRGVLQFGNAKASSPAGDQLVVSTISDTPAEKRLPSQPLDFYKFRE